MAVASSFLMSLTAPVRMPSEKMARLGILTDLLARVSSRMHATMSVRMP